MGAVWPEVGGACGRTGEGAEAKLNSLNTRPRNLDFILHDVIAIIIFPRGY